MLIKLKNAVQIYVFKYYFFMIGIIAVIIGGVVAYVVYTEHDNDLFPAALAFFPAWWISYVIVEAIFSSSGGGGSCLDASMRAVGC